MPTKDKKLYEGQVLTKLDALGATRIATSAPRDTLTLFKNPTKREKNDRDG